ncbi:MAG: hypothetical protein ACSLEN_12545 [Candidatus Malihini olakiniferum]
METAADHCAANPTTRNTCCYARPYDLKQPPLDEHQHWLAARTAEAERWKKAEQQLQQHDNTLTSLRATVQGIEKNLQTLETNDAQQQALVERWGKTAGGSTPATS